MSALFAFVFFGLFSPGPNVILLTASGARFGFVRTIPHLLGVVIGVGVIAGVVGLGFGFLLSANPALQTALSIFAALWILWMAWKLWHAQPAKIDETDRPFTFFQAVMFQWVNPKIWAVAVSAMPFVVDFELGMRALILAFTFSGINFGVCLFWTYAGSLLQRLLADSFYWRIFMRVMALALAVFSGLVLI